MSHLHRVLAAFVVLVLAGCGGSSNDSGEIEVISNSKDALDGYVTVDGFRDTVSGVRVGDLDHLFPARAARGFVSFNAPMLPAGAQIQRANLRMYQNVVIGDPFSMLRVIVVDQVSYGLTLDPLDYDTPAVIADVGTISNHNIPGFRDIDVTGRVIASLSNGDARIQFRLRLTAPETDNDGLEDIVPFEDGDNSGGTGNVPVLILKYTTP